MVKVLLAGLNVGMEDAFYSEKKPSGPRILLGWRPFALVCLNVIDKLTQKRRYDCLRKLNMTVEVFWYLWLSKGDETKCYCVSLFVTSWAQFNNLCIAVSHGSLRQRNMRIFVALHWRLPFLLVWIPYEASAMERYVITLLKQTNVNSASGLLWLLLNVLRFLPTAFTLFLHVPSDIEKKFFHFFICPTTDFQLWSWNYLLILLVFVLAMFILIIAWCGRYKKRRVVFFDCTRIVRHSMAYEASVIFE